MKQILSHYLFFFPLPTFQNHGASFPYSPLSITICFRELQTTVSVHPPPFHPEETAHTMIIVHGPEVENTRETANYTMTFNPSQRT